MELDELYQAVILDHSKRPRNQGPLTDPTGTGEGINPSCGDEIKVSVRLDDAGCLADIRFDARACAICTASASLMTTQVKKLPVGEIKNLMARFLSFLQTGEGGADLKNLQALSGVRRFPQRLKCATLPWHALAQALGGSGGDGDSRGI